MQKIGKRGSKNEPAKTSKGTFTYEGLRIDNKL